MGITYFISNFINKHNYQTECNNKYIIELEFRHI